MKTVKVIDKHFLFIFVLFSIILTPLFVQAATEFDLHKKRTIEMKPIDLNKKIKRFTFDSGLSFEYPDSVRGIYVTGHSAGGNKFNELLNLIESTDLNAMVIDIKDDFGYITFELDKDSKFHKYSKDYIADLPALLKTLEKHDVYPIARITAFKDTV